MIRRALNYARDRIVRIHAERRCTLGDGAVVYSPRLVTAFGGGIERIRIGRFSHIRGELLALPGGHIEIGEYSFVGESSRIWASEEIRIGSRVLISHGVTIVDSRTHPVDARQRHEHFKQIITTGHASLPSLGARPVEIADDVWIACNAVILRGVRLGRACIIGAGSVVPHDVAPYSVVAGNPARVVRVLEPDDHRGEIMDEHS